MFGIYSRAQLSIKTFNFYTYFTHFFVNGLMKSCCRYHNTRRQMIHFWLLNDTRSLYYKQQVYDCRYEWSCFFLWLVYLSFMKSWNTILEIWGMCNTGKGKANRSPNISDNHLLPRKEMTNIIWLIQIAQIYRSRSNRNESASLMIRFSRRFVYRIYQILTLANAITIALMVTKLHWFRIS